MATTGLARVAVMAYVLAAAGYVQEMALDKKQEWKVQLAIIALIVAYCFLAAFKLELITSAAGFGLLVMVFIADKYKHMGFDRYHIALIAYLLLLLAALEVDAKFTGTDPVVLKTLGLCY